MMYKFGAAYGSDVKKVKEIIWDAIERCPNVVKDPRPILRFESMDDNAITFFVLVWVDERANRHSITDFLNTEIYDAFNRSGIEIPFPQRTVWIRYEDDQLRKIRGEPLGPRRATVPAVPAAPPVGPVVSGSRVGSKDTDQDQGD
jgi:small-conductance mechanosensitive channel